MAQLKDLKGRHKMNRWSSDKKMKLLFENFRGFVNEVEESPQEKLKDTAQIMQQLGAETPGLAAAGKSFIIMVGGPGTGKGGMINTDRFMGSITKATGGKMAAKDFIRKLPPGTINQFDSEVDSVLRLMQWNLAAEDWKKLDAAAKSPQQWETVVQQYHGSPQGDINLIITIAKALGIKPEVLKSPEGMEQLRTAFVQTFPSIEAYAGKKDEDNRKALKKMGGNGAIVSMYMQLRSGWGEDPGLKTIKKAAVKRYNKELKGQLELFLSQSKEQVTEAEEEGTAGSAQQVAAAGNVEGKLRQVSKDVFILDSAGEDLPSQDYAGQLKIAKDAGFETSIVWIKTGPEISYLGNLERAVVGGKRAVPPQEIEDYYSAAAGEGEGVGGEGENAAKYFYSLLRVPYGDGALLDNLIVVMNKGGDRATPEDVTKIASDVCINPIGDPDAEPKDNISHWLCKAAEIKRITGYDIEELPPGEEGVSPANYNELEKAIMLDFEEARKKGKEIPQEILDAGVSKEDILNPEADLQSLAKKIKDLIQSDLETKIRHDVQQSKGGEFTSKTFTSPLKESKTYDRWKLLAGIR
tara:strand:- start:6627 stop:8366 length:1740 start_codon:yes stop_codon:yes gene_type:complete